MPAKLEGEGLPEVEDLEEVDAMLAEAAERRIVSEARQEQLTRWMERIFEASSPAEVSQG